MHIGDSLGGGPVWPQTLTQHGNNGPHSNTIHAASVSPQRSRNRRGQFQIPEYEVANESTEEDHEDAEVQMINYSNNAALASMLMAHNNIRLSPSRRIGAESVAQIASTTNHSLPPRRAVSALSQADLQYKPLTRLQSRSSGAHSPSRLSSSLPKIRTSNSNLVNSTEGSHSQQQQQQQRQRTEESSSNNTTVYITHIDTDVNSNNNSFNSYNNNNNNNSSLLSDVTKNARSKARIFASISKHNESESFGSLEVWPANGRETSKSTQAKPRFLLELERFLSEELKRNQCEGEGFNPSRLQIFRECFRMFAEQFKTYKPIINRIISEYEAAINYYTDQLHEMTYVKNQLSTLEQEHEHMKEELTARWKIDTDRLKKEIEELRDINQEGKQTQTKLKVEIKVLKENVHELHEVIEEHDRRNKILLASVQKLEGGGAAPDMSIDYARRLEEEQKKVKKISMELQSALEDLAKCKQRIQELSESSGDPELSKKFEKVQKELQARNNQYYALKTKHGILTAQHDALQQKYNKAAEDLERTAARLKVFEEGDLSPRPNWNTYTEKIQFAPLTANDTATRVHDLILYTSQLEKDKADIEAKLEEAKKFIGLAGREARQNEIAENAAGGGEGEKKWFLGLGTGPEVPKYLRCTGKVRNKNLSKRDCELTVKEYWSEKIKYERDKKKREPPAAFFYFFLHKKYGIQSMIVEWGYNMMDALKKYSYDPDCKMLLQILTGELEEDVYYDQMNMLERVQSMFFKLDSALQNGGKPTGLIPKDKIAESLKEFFPAKSEDFFHRLMVCLNKDNPSPMVQYKALFQEDKDFNQSEFVEELRLQHVTEREEYLDEIEEEIFEFDTDNDGVVSIDEMRGAVKSVDPNKPLKELDKMLVTALGLANEDELGPLQEDGKRKYKSELSAPIADMMKRLRASIVRRHSKKRTAKEKENQNSIAARMKALDS